MAFIAMQMASTPHAASTERGIRGNERETGVGCCAYTHFFPRLSTFSSSLSYLFHPLSSPLSTILRSLLVSTLSSLPLFHSPLSSQFSSRFFLGLAISRNMRLHSALRPLYIISSLSRYYHPRKNSFFRKKKKKERKQRDQRRKKQN